MPFSYRQVKDLYDILHSSGAVTKSLPDWSREMGDLSESDLYGAGLTDNWIKRGSVGIDKVLEASGLTDVGRSVGGAFGGAFGQQAAGEEIGAGLPRMAVNFLPVMAAEAASGGAATPFLLGAGLAGTAGLSGAETYTSTGSPAAGLLSGVTAAALPYATGKIEQGALSFLAKRGLASPRIVEGPIGTSWAGRELGPTLSGAALDTSYPTQMEAVKRLFPTTFGSRVAMNVAGQVGAAGIMEASGLGQDVLAGRDLHNPFSAETALNLTLGQLPFALLHLGGKLVRGKGESPNAQADRLQSAVDYTVQQYDKHQAYEAAQSVPEIEKIKVIPEGEIVPPTAQSQAQLDEILRNLRGEREKISADVTPQNVENLDKIADAETEVLQKMVDQNGGVGVGLYKEPSDLPREGVRGREITYGGAGSQKYRTIELEDGTVLRYSRGKYEKPPVLDEDKSGNGTFFPPTDPKWFSLLPKRDSVVRPKDKGVGTEDLPIQKAQLDLAEYTKDVKELRDLTMKMDSATEGERIQMLEPINRIREKLGIDQIDLASVMNEARKRKLPVGKTIKALALETANFQENEMEVRAQDLVRFERQNQIRQRISSQASPGSEEELILNYADELARAGGRRNLAITSGRFWEKVGDLDNRGQLTLARVKAAVGDMVETGKGLVKEKVVQNVDKSPLFQALSSDEAANYQIAAKAVMKILGSEGSSDEGRIFKTWLLHNVGGTPNFTKEAFMEAIMDAGVEDTEAGAAVMAEEFVQNPKVLDWLKTVKELGDNPPPKLRAPGAIEDDQKQLPAGGGFVWNLGPYDEAKSTLGGKPIAKSGWVSIQGLKSVAGRGKPLQDVEIEMMRAVDKVVGGGAFEGQNVNVKKLTEVLRDNPVTVETHVYGMDGKPSEAKLALAEMTHNWLDTLSIARRNDSELLDERFEKNVDFLRKQGWSDEELEKARKYSALKAQVDAEGADASPRATAYYKSISPFDTDKYPVVRVDVTIPQRSYDVPAEMEDQIKRQKELGGSDNLRTGPYGKTWLDKPLWQQDNTHENLPNTLGWAMVQFIPESLLAEHNPEKYGGLKGSDKKVMFVGESQSRWGQEVQKRIARIKDTINKEIAEDFSMREFDSEGEKGIVVKTPGITKVFSDEGYEKAAKEFYDSRIKDYTEVRTKDFGPNQFDHPLLPIQHLLVLKAAIDEAAKRGVDKLVLSDAETAMMTEMHDKIDRFSIVNKETGKEWGTYNDRATAEQNLNFKENSDQFEIKENRPSQEGGMRLHYDTTLTSGLKKLTGDEGKKVELGVHKNGGAMQSQLFEEGDREDAVALAKQRGGEIEKDAAGWRVFYREGSPVFKNPDGLPKSSITGTVYDLSKIQSTLKSQGGPTLGDPTRMRMPEEEAYVPKKGEEADVKHFSGGATELLRPILESSSPQNAALAKHLLDNFPVLLRSITSGVGVSDGTYATAHETGVHINFDPSILDAAPWAQEQTKLHEIVHGLTSRLIDDPGTSKDLIDRLTAIRQKGIDGFSKKQRTQFDKIIASKWYERNIKNPDSAPWDELAPDAEGFTSKDRQVFYGLLSNHELLAQTFSTNSMRKHLQTIESKGAWSSFKGWVKELLKIGTKTDDTLLGELLDTTHQLMTQGEYLANAQEFGERWFDSQGKGGDYGEWQTGRALALVGESFAGTSKEELMNGLNGQWPSPALREARVKVETMFTEKGLEADSATSILSELGHTPNMEGLSDMTSIAVTEGHDLSDVLDLLPPKATAFIFEKLHDHADVLGMIQAAVKEKNEGLVNIANPKLLRKPVNDTLKGIQSLLKNEARLQAFATQLVGLNSVEPQNFMTDKLRAPQQLEDFVDGAKSTVGGIGSWLKNFLQPMGQFLREAGPEAAEAVTKGFQLAANTRKMVTESTKPFALDSTSPHLDIPLSKKELDDFVQGSTNPKLLGKIDRWIYENQKAGKDKVVLLDEANPDVAKLLSGLSNDEKQIVRDMVAKQGKSIQILNAQKLEKMRQIAVVSGAGMAGIDTGLKTKENIQLAQTLLEGLEYLQDPTKATIGNATLQSVQSRMQPEAFVTLVKFMSNELEKLTLWKQYFAENPNWATAQRTEQYLVRFSKGGKNKVLQASSIKEGRVLIEKHGGREIAIEDQWKGKEDEPFQLGNITPEMAKRMQDLEENQIGMLLSRGLLSKEELPEYRRTSAIAQTLREAEQERAIPGVNLPARLLSQGAEDLPYLWNHLSYVQRESAYWNRALLRAQARTYLRDPEISKVPEVQTKLRTYFDNLLHPDPQVAQNMTRFASTWFLGFNMASSMINATQPFTTHVAELTSMTGKPLDSYRRVLSALAEIGGKFVGGKDWSSPEHHKLMEEAVKDSQVGYGMYDEEAATQESVSVQFKQAMSKNKVQTLGQKLGSLAGIYSNVAMWVFQHGERVNSRAALLAAFDLYREQGLSYNEAKSKAYEFNQSVNYSGGRAQRPVGAFSGRGPTLRTAAMLGTSLQSYVLGTTFQIGRYLQRGLFRPQGLTPHEVYSARKAAIQMLGTQLFAAGLLGLPFASGAIALLNQMFPDLELPRKLRSGLNEFLSSDKDQGSVLSDIAMTGVPSMLGWDLQSRLSMGNTLPGVSEVNGFQPENLMGPSGNIVRNFVQGIQGWSKGDLSKSSKFLPPAVAKAIETGTAALTDGGAIRDFQGRPLSSPTIGENVGQALGFQPKRLSDVNAASRIANQAQDVQRSRTVRENQELAQEVLKGNFGTVRQALVQKSQADKDFDPVQTVRQISQSAEELTFPRDLRREGIKGTQQIRSSFLSSYSNLSSSPSETDRFRFRSGIEAKLGLPATKESQQELLEAQMMDKLRVSQPQATRSELKATVQSLLRRHASAQRSLSSPPE